MPIQTFHPIYHATTPDVVRAEIRNAVQEGRAPRTAPLRADRQTAQAEAPSVAALAAPEILAYGVGRSSLGGPAGVGLVVGSGLSPANPISGPSGTTYAQPTPVTPSMPVNALPTGDNQLRVATAFAKTPLGIALLGALGLGAGIVTARFIWG